MLRKTRHTIPEELTGAALANDLRVQEAKQLLVEAVEEHSQKITGVKPPNSALATGYKEVLEGYADLRGGNLWYDYISSGIGNGPLVELLDGSVKYDFISGIGPHYFGHSYAPFIEASIDAAVGDTVMQGHLQQGAEGIALCERLLEGAGWLPESARPGHCFLSTSGVMAVENGLKIAFQARMPATRILAFERCFMGRTLAASQITDKAAYRVGLPDTVAVDYVPFYDPDDPEGSVGRAADKLQQYIDRYPGKHAVMCFEMVQGEGGFRVGHMCFFEKLMQICRDNDILCMIDEVQSFGRTPQIFAFNHFGLDEYVDLVTIGKVSQVCATLFRADIKPKPGLLSQTFTGSTQTLTAAQVVVDTLLDDGFMGPEGKIAQLHDYFVQNFENMAKRHPGQISGPYGIGGMIAFTPYDGDAKRALDFTYRLFDNGVIAFVCGSNPTRVRFLPPMGVLERHHIDEVLSIVEKTLGEA